MGLFDIMPGLTNLRKLKRSHCLSEFLLGPQVCDHIQRVPETSLVPYSFSVASRACIFLALYKGGSNIHLFLLGNHPFNLWALPLTLSQVSAVGIFEDKLKGECKYN